MHSAAQPAAQASPLVARKSQGLKGRIRVPGDKSVSHRSMLIGLLTVGRTEIVGLLEGEDVIATSHACRALGGIVQRKAAGNWVVQGVGIGSLLEPAGPLDFGNAGTGVRLAMGVIAGHPVIATFDGDESLRRRPMRRVLDPLAQMGAVIVDEKQGGRLPIRMKGARDPIPIVYETPVPSAQVKSAVLLCGLAAPGETTVIEKESTRDHTERMLSYFGADIVTEPYGAHGRKIRLKGRPELQPKKILVPADPSSAAFPLVAALITPGSDVVIEGVLANPLRDGLVITLREMGGHIEEVRRTEDGGETIVDLRVKYSALKGVDVPPERAPSMIDEYPVLAVAASFAEGETRMRGLKELRVKESDRLAAVADGLKANGVEHAIDGDDLIVRGKNTVKGGGTVVTHMDHRIAMSFLVMGLASEKDVGVDDASFVATSFPGFAELMRGLGADIR